MGMEKRYCAFCRAERSVYLKRHAGLLDTAVAFAMAFLIMVARWQSFNPKVIVFFLAFLTAMEIVIQVRFRLGIVCKLCGFDPVIYKKNPELAAKQVKFRLDHIQDDPDLLLSQRAQTLLRRLKRTRHREARFKNQRRPRVEIQA
jgi:hypothetical protein